MYGCMGAVCQSQWPLRGWSWYLLFVKSIRNGDVMLFSETFLNSPTLRRGTQLVSAWDNCDTIWGKMVQIHEGQCCGILWWWSTLLSRFNVVACCDIGSIAECGTCRDNEFVSTWQLIGFNFVFCRNFAFKQSNFVLLSWSLVWSTRSALSCHARSALSCQAGALPIKKDPLQSRRWRYQKKTVGEKCRRLEI